MIDAHVVGQRVHERALAGVRVGPRTSRCAPITDAELRVGPSHLARETYSSASVGIGMRDGVRSCFTYREDDVVVTGSQLVVPAHPSGGELAQQACLDRFGGLRAEERSLDVGEAVVVVLGC